MKVLLIILAVFVGFGLLLATPELVVLAFTFFTGWISAGLRLFRDLPFSAIDITLFTAGCLLLVLGLHAFVRSLCPWSFRWTAAAIGILAFVLVSIMSLVGTAHQVGWILLSSEPVFKDRRLSSREQMDLQNVANLIAMSADTNIIYALFNPQLPDTRDAKRPWEKYRLLLPEGTNDVAVLCHRDDRIHRRIGAAMISPHGQVRLEPAGNVPPIPGKAHTYAAEAY